MPIYKILILIVSSNLLSSIFFWYKNKSKSNTVIQSYNDTIWHIVRIVYTSFFFILWIINNYIYYILTIKYQQNESIFSFLIWGNFSFCAFMILIMYEGFCNLWNKIDVDNKWKKTSKAFLIFWHIILIMCISFAVNIVIFLLFIN